jgi:hypothetical protein
MKIPSLFVCLFLISCNINAQTWQWTHPEPNGITSGDNDQIHVTAVDAQKNVYTLGDYNDSLYLNNVLRTVGQGSYIAKYDSLGNLLWYKLITISPLSEETNITNATDMVVNNNGIFLTGIFSPDSSTLYQIGTYTFGKYPDSTDGRTNLFFCEMDFNGNVVWNKTSNFSPPHKYYINGGIGSIGGGSYVQTRLATDNKGNIFLGGICDPEDNAQFTIGNDVIPIKPKPANFGFRNVFDMFIVKYNSSGNLAWSQNSFDSSTANANLNLSSMTCDGNGNLFIYATVNNKQKFGSITYNSSDKTNQYGDCLIKIPSVGGWSFVSELCGYSNDYVDNPIPRLLACDNSNNIYSLVNVAQADGVPARLLRKVITLPYNDNPQPYLVKMDNSGNVLWSKYFSATGIQLRLGGFDDYAYGIYYSNNQLYITGSVRSGANPDYLVFSKLTVPFIPSSNPGLNYYVAKCDTSGNFNWVTNFGAGSNTEGNAVCADGSGNIYTGGLYRVDVETLGNLNGNFKNSDIYTYNIFFGKLKDQYVHIDSVSSTTVCPGSNISIPFQSFGLAFSSSNTFTAELSDSIGSFRKPKTIGSTQSTGTGTITATIPANQLDGHGYIVRIKSSDTLATGSPYYTYADTNYKITVLCPAPSSGFAATNVKTTAATLNWTPTSCATGYKLQFRKTGTTAWKTDSISTNTDTLTITGLTANTTYQWHISTKCVNNKFSAFSAINTLTTAASFIESAGNSAAIASPGVMGLIIEPNPAQTNSMLVISGTIKNATVLITDVLGKTVWEKTDVNENQIDLPVERFAAGVYIIRVINNGEVSMVKLVKE